MKITPRLPHVATHARLQRFLIRQQREDVVIIIYVHVQRSASSSSSSAAARINAIVVKQFELTVTRARLGRLDLDDTHTRTHRLVVLSIFNGRARDHRFENASSVRCVGSGSTSK